MERQSRYFQEIRKRIISTTLIASLTGCAFSDDRTDKSQICNPNLETGFLKDIQTNKRDDILVPTKSYEPKKIPYFREYRSQGYDKAIEEKYVFLTNLESKATTDKIRSSNVVIIVETPEIDRFCNGTHIGKGRIATAAHCLTGFKPEELKIKVVDSKKIEHDGVFFLNIPKVDAAIVQTADDSYPGKAKIGRLENIPPNNYVTVYASEQPGETSFYGVYIGGYNNEEEKKGCSDISSQNKFLFFTGGDKAKHGHSGSGIFHKETGELVGVLSSILNEGVHEIQMVEGVRSELVGYLNSEVNEANSTRKTREKLD